MIFLSDIPWAALYQRPQHLAARFAGKQKLLWVEPAVLGQPPRRIPTPIRENIDGMVLPYLPYNARNVTLRAIARGAGGLPPARWALERLQRSMLSGAMAHAGIAPDSAHVYLQNFQAIRAIRKIRPARIVYDCIDNPFGFASLPRAVHRLWHETMDAADLLIATSPVLASLLERNSGRRAHLISNGVEYERFTSPVTRPRDLPDDGTPVAGYVGSVYPWIDFALLERLCLSLPDVRIVVIGKEHPEVRPHLAALARFPNFLFLGPRPYETIPGYLRTFRAGLIPFLRTSLTEGVNPVKLYEYAASGIVPVATDFSPDLGAFRHVASVCGTADEFIEAVRASLRPDERRAEALRAFARTHDWNAKAAEILALLR